jgi:hypothetical protein
VRCGERAAHEVLVARGDVEDCAAAGDVEPSVCRYDQSPITYKKEGVNEMGEVNTYL